MNNSLVQQRPAAAEGQPTETAILTDATRPEVTDSTPPKAPAPAGRSRLPGRFARLPELAGAGFLPLGLFARLPLAMLTVGALTLVTATSGSYAVGGAAAAAVGIGSALGAPVLGSLADRAGQRKVLLVAAVANALAVSALLAASYLGAGATSLIGSWQWSPGPSSPWRS